MGVDQPTGWKPCQGWLHVYAPVAGVVAYLLGKPMLVQLCKLLNTTGKSYPFFLLMVLHNLFLALFSAVVWYESWAVSAPYRLIAFNSSFAFMHACPTNPTPSPRPAHRARAWRSRADLAPTTAH